MSAKGLRPFRARSSIQVEELNTPLEMTQPKIATALPLRARPPPALTVLSSIDENAGSVWDKYTKCFEIELGQKYIVAQRQTGSRQLFLIRKTERNNPDGTIRLLRQLRAHRGFVACFEVFVSSSPADLDMVCEYVDLTLLHIMQVQVFPSETQVAAATGQVR